VRVTGLRAAGGPVDLTIPAEPPAFVYQLPSGLQLAYPPFAPGAAIDITGSGGDIGSFMVSGKGISPLAVTDETIFVEAGKPTRLHWTAPTGAETTRVHVSLNISVHAGTKGTIECDVADTGSLEIAAPLVTGLVALGIAGFPSVTITRTALSSASVSAGRLELSILCEQTRLVIVPGQTSCVEDRDCPAGKTCQTSLLCQ
jgi:hypothetical protein